MGELGKTFEAPGDGEQKIAENLTSQELMARKEKIETIRASVDEWIREHVPAGEQLDQEKLGVLVKFIGDECRASLDTILVPCASHEKYVERPSVKLYDGVDGKAPDIWLLGWRGGESDLDAAPTEETAIHDHVDSEAAIHVYQGTIQEKIFGFNAEEWKKIPEALNYEIAERRLQEGSTATIGSPYIHFVSGIHGQKLAATIHAYYPPLDSMNFYKEDGGKLIKTGSWSETRETPHC